VKNLSVKKVMKIHHKKPKIFLAFYLISKFPFPRISIISHKNFGFQFQRNVLKNALILARFSLRV
jgi:hypothetical protein